VLSGRVVDENGQGVAHARLEVRMRRRAPSGPSAGSVLSGEDGSYALRGLVAGEWLELEVQAQGYQPLVLSELRLADDEIRSSFDVHLQSAGTLDVTVFDAAGRPADRCLVRLRKVTGDPSGKEDERNAARSDAKLTDVQGRVLFEGLTPGRWKVEARSVNAPREQPSEQTFLVRSRESTSGVLHLR
jgi:protocatechuate 3,4-dioxygenase beta subunit